jgi:hypothetical protein
MSPSIILSLVIATVYGCGFHAVFGRRLWQWPIFWLSAVAGFFLGYVLGVATGLEFGRIGSVPLVASTFGAAVALALAWYFTDVGDR